MDQSRALNAVAPFIALAKSATSPRAAVDLITQATSAPNTFVFAELLQQDNIKALAGHEQFGQFYELLKCFAWGTWEDAKHLRGVQLSDAQALKLRLLSLMTIASEPAKTASTKSNLSYSSLTSRLDLASPIDLEHLVTQAIYSNLITATLNPANQTVVVTSVSPLRDLAPGSVESMLLELDAWSARCTSMVTDLENEIAKVKADAARRHTREQTTERQVNAAVENGDKSGGSVLGPSRGGHNAKGGTKGQNDEDEDAMDVDASSSRMHGGGKKRGGGGMGSLLGKMTGHRGR